MKVGYLSLKSEAKIHAKRPNEQRTYCGRVISEGWRFTEDALDGEDFQVDCETCWYALPHVYEE